jgi:uncharacterized protein (UPF0335 family)
MSEEPVDDPIIRFIKDYEHTMRTLLESHTERIGKLETEVRALSSRVQDLEEAAGMGTVGMSEEEKRTSVRKA